MMANILASGLLLTCFSLFKGAANDLISIRDSHKRLTIELTVAHRSRDIVNDLDSHPLPIFPRVHAAGTITYLDGTFVKLSKPASPNSTPITYLTLNARDSLLTGSPEPENQIYRFSVCPMFTFYSGKAVDSYLAVTPDSYIELVSVEEKSPTNLPKTPCRSLPLSFPKRSMLSSQMTHSLKYVRALVPIKSLYTLYSDEERTLRYLSHRGESIQENQPIIEDASRLTFTQESDNTQTHTSLKYELQLKNDRMHTNSLVNRIPRASNLQFLLTHQ